MKRFNIKLEAHGQSADIQLCTRAYNLPELPDLRYFWMDKRRVRGGSSNQMQACIDLWWACMESEGLTEHREHEGVTAWSWIEANQMTLALAELYIHVASSRAQQRVLRDAELGKCRDRAGEDYIVDDEERQRLQALVERRDVEAVRTEMARIFWGPDARKPEWTDELNLKLQPLVLALQNDGRAGLRQRIRDYMLPFLTKRRKRGGNPQEHALLNQIIYEAKTSFYTCLANTWVLLIPELKLRLGLTGPEELLLRLWHHQNDDGHQRDVFWGQLLAMHPFSLLLLESPDHGTVLSRFLQAGQQDADAATNWENPRYRALILSILQAGQQYMAESAARLAKDDERQRLGAAFRRLRGSDEDRIYKSEDD